MFRVCIDGGGGGGGGGGGAEWLLDHGSDGAASGVLYF